MAVVNTYVQSGYLNATGQIIPDNNTGSRIPAILDSPGAPPVTLRSVFQLGATDSVGSVYRIWANVPATYVPLMMVLASDGTASTTSAELGIYLPNGGAVVSAGLFATGLNLTTAATTLDPRYAQDGLAAIGLANSAMNIIALANVTPGYQSCYDIALTIVTVAPGAAGTIALWAMFAVG